MSTTIIEKLFSMLDEYREVMPPDIGDWEQVNEEIDSFFCQFPEIKTYLPNILNLWNGPDWLKATVCEQSADEGVALRCLCETDSLLKLAGTNAVYPLSPDALFVIKSLIDNESNRMVKLRFNSRLKDFD